MDLLERVGLETGKGNDQNAHATTLEDRVVGHVEQSSPSETRPMIEPSTGIADDSYHFRVNLPLKKSLNDCRQTVHTDHIRIHHNLKIYVNIHNPDGHVSQLCLRNLMHIYISPHMPINEDQTVSENTSSLVHLNPNSASMEQDAPPTYGSHVLDQLYSDIDQSGFISGVATPHNFLSRRQSVENFAGAFPSFYQSSAGSSARSSSSIPDSAALQLQSRLAALQDRRPSISSVTQSLGRLAPGAGLAVPANAAAVPPLLHPAPRQPRGGRLPAARAPASREWVPCQRPPRPPPPPPAPARHRPRPGPRAQLQHGRAHVDPAAAALGSAGHGRAGGDGRFAGRVGRRRRAAELRLRVRADGAEQPDPRAGVAGRRGRAAPDAAPGRPPPLALVDAADAARGGLAGGARGGDVVAVASAELRRRERRRPGGLGSAAVPARGQRAAGAAAGARARAQRRGGVGRGAAGAEAATVAAAAAAAASGGPAAAAERSAAAETDHCHCDGRGIVAGAVGGEEGEDRINITADLWNWQVT